MGASLQAGPKADGTGRRRKGRRHRPMAEINVTPFVDVMLVLLIIFMVAAPMLSVGVPVDLPKSEGGAPLESKESEPLSVSVNASGKIFIQDTEISLDELQPKLEAITSARKGLDELIFVRGDKTTNYGELIAVMGRIAASGYKHISLVTQVDEGRAKK